MLEKTETLSDMERAAARREMDGQMCDFGRDAPRGGCKKPAYGMLDGFDTEAPGPMGYWRRFYCKRHLKETMKALEAQADD